MTGAATDNINSVAGSSVGTGSFVSTTGERLVFLTVSGANVVLSLAGARLLAKQINDWSDLQEKQAARSPMRWLVDYVVKAGKAGEWKLASEDDKGNARFEHTPPLPADHPPAKPTNKRRARAKAA